jgi:microsomal epoxide hydrolase
VEFLEAMGPLTDPVKYGGAPEDAFDVVAPSLPGFGFSSKPKGKPVGPVTVARLWHMLMTEVLGYTRYASQGGDWGSAVTTQLAVQFPEELIGIHFNGVTIPVSADGDLSEAERDWLRTAAAFRSVEVDYFNEQAHKPQTVSFVLSDNPVGTAAWIVEKMRAWSDSDDTVSAFTKDQVLANVMFYLVSSSEATGVWIYRGNSDERSIPRPPRIMVPTGFASYPKEMPIFTIPRSLLERNFNLIQYSPMPRGGHFACFEQPELFVENLRSFARKLRS